MDADDLGTLWVKLLETEGALITDGFHVVGARCRTPTVRPCWT